MFRFKTLSVRARLTVWYVLVFGLVLLLFIGGTSVALYWQLFRQLTRFAIQDVETVEGLLAFDDKHRLFFNEGYHNHPESRFVLERMLEVLTPDGKTLLRNSRLGENHLGAAVSPDEGVNGYSERSVALRDGTRALLVSRRHTLRGGDVLIRLAYSESAIWIRIHEFLVASFTALPFLLSVAALFGYQLAKRSLSPLEDMAHRAQQITAERLGDRLPVDNEHDELGHLARVVNNLLDRLEQAFEQLRRFTADASHELRTPLAAIRSVGEVGLQQNRTPENYRDTIGSMLEEVNRLTRLTESLLTISRADGGQIRVDHVSYSPVEIAGEAVGLVGVLAEERNQTIVVQGDPGILAVGDRILFRQALINLLHNAVKYSPAGDSIAINVNRTDSQAVVVQVRDNGPGIDPVHRAKIFDRFYRVDNARSRETGGVGLGLAIAQWSIQAQGGVIRVEDIRAGAVFTIELPAVTEVPPR